MKLLIFAAVSFPFFVFAKDMSVSDCAKNLTRGMFDLKDDKARAICKKYPQKTVNCAMEMVRQHRLSQTIDTALEECDRDSDNGREKDRD